MFCCGCLFQIYNINKCFETRNCSNTDFINPNIWQKYSNNSESSSLRISTDSMRTPEDLVEFSLETRTSSGRDKSFTSLNDLNQNHRKTNGNDQVTKTIYIYSQPLPAYKMLQKLDPKKSQRLLSSINQEDVQMKLDNSRKYRLSFDKGSSGNEQIHNNSFVNAGLQTIFE